MVVGADILKEMGTDWLPSSRRSTFVLVDGFKASAPQEAHLAKAQPQVAHRDMRSVLADRSRDTAGVGAGVPQGSVALFVDLLVV